MKTSSYTKAPPIEPSQIAKNVVSVIGKATLDPEALKELSPKTIPEFGQEQTACLVRTLFREHESLHLTWKSQKLVEGKIHEGMHAGFCMDREKILGSLATEALDQQGGGYLYTINPVGERPSGKLGFVRDLDCKSWRYVLAECDDIPLEHQAALLVRLPIPIKAIVSSGGRSLHAIIEVNAADGRSYNEIAKKLLRALARLGFDPSCSNPSRKSRLPGFTRSDPETQEFKKQELLYLCENPKPEAII